MKKKSFVFPIAALATLSLSGCKVTTDPNKDFVEEALGYYKKLRENEGITDDKAEFHAWYYDSHLLKGVVFNSLTDYEYLGLVNFQNLCFSETENKYYMDIPNYEVGFDFETGDVTMPEFFENPIDFVNELPLVLIKNDEEFDKEDVYSKFNENGEIVDEASSDNYDPMLFYLNDFSYSFDNEALSEFNLNYEGKATAILKRDVYGLIEDAINESGVEIPLDISITNILLRSYNKSNKIEDDSLMPDEVTIPGTFNGKEVVVGPMGLSQLFTTRSIDDVSSIVIEDGVTTLSFFALDGAKKLTNLILPSTLSDLSLSSLANLNLDTLYVSDTENEIDIIEANGLNLNFEFDFNGESEEITIGAPFDNTTISNKLIFENYDNKNVGSFPYNDVNFTNGVNNSLTFVNSAGEGTYNSISEGLSDNDAFNPMFSLNNIGENKEISDVNLKSINADKHLYLSTSKFDLNNNLYLADSNVYRSFSYVKSDSGNEKIKLKLLDDLEISGELVLSGVIGSNGTLEGLIVGDYATLDLNGHKITIKNGGIIDSNGLITDSSIDRTGEIIVENGGTIKTNLVTNSLNSIAYQTSLEKGISPFSTYDTRYLNTKVTLVNGANFIVKNSTFSPNLVYQNKEINFIGENGVFSYDNLENTDGEIVINSGDNLLNIDINNDVTFNGFSYIDSKNREAKYDIYFPLVNEKVNINLIDGSLTLNSKASINYGGTLNINGSLNLNNQLFVLNTFNNRDGGELKLNGTLNINENAGLKGNVNVSETIFNQFKNNNFNNLNVNFTYLEGSFDTNNQVINIDREFNYPLIVKFNEYEYYRNNNSYYYLNNNEIYLSNGDIIGSKSNDSSEKWVIIYNKENIDVTSNNNYPSRFTSLDKLNTYIINDDASIIELPNSDENSIYTLDGETYILYQDKLVKGDLIRSLTSFDVFSSDDGRYFVKDNGASNYELTYTFEKDHLLAISKSGVNISLNNFDPNDFSKLYFIEDENNIIEIPLKNYDYTHHLISYQNRNYLIDINGQVIENVSLDADNNLICLTSNSETYAYGYVNGWEKVDRKGNTDFYRTSISTGIYDGLVYLENNGNPKFERCLEYNNEFSRGYIFYRLVDLDTINPTSNFALLNKETEKIDVLTKVGGLNFKLDDLAEGIRDALPSDVDDFIGYRYFILNGEYYIFVNNENEDGSANIEMVKLNRSPVYNDLILEENEKIDFRMLFSLLGISVTLEDGREVKYYLDLNNVIASGDNASLEDNSYLGLAVYKSTFDFDLNELN